MAQDQGTPLPVDAPPEAPAVDAASEPTPVPPPDTPTSSYLGFPDKIAFHRFSGWMSGGTLLAAGALGGVHLLQMMDEAHQYRSGGEGDFDPAVCGPILVDVWGSNANQGLRWTHVALLSLGELFYGANAVTGSSLIGPLPPGWNSQRIHRYAFFTHAGMMVAEIALGFAMSDALSRGDHETMIGLGTAHLVLGILDPAIILAAGAIMPK